MNMMMTIMLTMTMTRTMTCCVALTTVYALPCDTVIDSSLCDGYKCDGAAIARLFDFD